MQPFRHFGLDNGQGNPYLLSTTAQVSSVEIERICNSVSDAILETAAIGVPPSTGGPEQLVVAVVFKNQNSLEENLDKLKLAFNSALQKKLNPLFKVLAFLVSFFILF